MDKREYLKSVNIGGTDHFFYDIGMLGQNGLADISRLPFSIKVLVENLLRKLDGRIVNETDVLNIARWQKTYDAPVEIPYHPARVLMQDFTGVPAVVDLAVMRDAVKEKGGNPSTINPQIPVELIVDHSIQVDSFGTVDALRQNVEKEYERNLERYALLKWAQKSFDNFSVVPPNSGICHQVNLEYLGKVIVSDNSGKQVIVYPDTLVGTDSHTTMINGIGVVGWGVGGIEAEAVMLGQPYYMSIPEVIGVRMTGELREGVTATDLVLTVTQLLRDLKVVEKFVEYFGPGMKKLSVPDRATLSNMSPEYGATIGFFPVDEKTVEYLEATGRSERAKIVESCSKALGLFYTGTENPEYTHIVDVDLSKVGPCLAGPARPQDRIELKEMKRRFGKSEGGADKKTYPVSLHGENVGIRNGSIVIAAITSCTNTSNPFVLIGAGLLAKNAVEKGLRVKPYVKTSFAPGSRAVIRYLNDAGLMPYFQALGFHLAAFGCTTCIGNSGPLHPEIERTVSENKLTVAAVLSGNRNFEARIHQKVRANYLASPMLVVAFALAGKADIDMENDPLGTDPNGTPIFLRDIWPNSEDIRALVREHVKSDSFTSEYAKIFDGDELWQNLKTTESTVFDWDAASTYIRKPPYFDEFELKTEKPADISGARALLMLGDSVTTDHISPAGAISETYPAGRYLKEKNVRPADFNSYGSRRGNHEVMMRGTFGNIRIRNMMTAKEGSHTVKYPEQEEMFVYDAAMKYKTDGTPLVVLGGAEYGTGSSRDWAAKGTILLGIKAVIAGSFERIHRSNLIGMGVLPLVFENGETWQTLGLDGSEVFSITGIADMQPRKTLQIRAEKKDGQVVAFEVTAKLNTDVEVAYFEHGGILPYVLRKMLG